AGPIAAGAARPLPVRLSELPVEPDAGALALRTPTKRSSALRQASARRSADAPTSRRGAAQGTDGTVPAVAVGADAAGRGRFPRRAGECRVKRRRTRSRANEDQRDSGAVFL